MIKQKEKKKASTLQKKIFHSCHRAAEAAAALGLPRDQVYKLAAGSRKRGADCSVMSTLVPGGGGQVPMLRSASGTLAPFLPLANSHFTGRRAIVLCVQANRNPCLEEDPAKGGGHIHTK